MEPKAYNDRTCVVVVRLDNASVGLVVDTVNEVADIPEDQVSPPPRVSGAKSSRYLQGMGKIGDEVKILLDVNKLLYDEELEQLKGGGFYEG